MKTLFSLLVLCAASAHIHAAIILSDTFAYTNGVLTNVSNGKWRHTSGGADEVNVTNGVVELTRSETEDVDAALAVSYSGSSGATLYSRFSIFVLSPPSGANGNYFAHFGGTARARVFAVTNGAAAGKFRLGIANGTTTASTIWPIDLNTNQSYTVVTRLAISNAQATLWINPTVETDLSIAAADAATATTANVYAWRQDTAMGVLTVDNLFVATSFAEALAGNETPSISDVPDQQVVENAGTVPIPFTIGDAETPADFLGLGASGTNVSGSVIQNLSFGGSGSNRILNVILNPNQTGTANLTLSVNDGVTTNKDSFVLTVVPALIFSEDFSYADGALITNGSPPWVHHSGTTTGQIQVVSGKIILSTAFTEDVSVSLPGGPYATNTGLQLYTSFRLNFSQLPGSSGDYFAHFNTTGARCRLFANTSNAGTNKFRLGIANAGAAVSEQLAVDLATNTSHLVVLRYNPLTAVTTVWANPSSESDPGTNATDSATATAISSFAFREDPGIGTFSIDELRIGLSFAAVTGSSAPRLRIERVAPGKVRLAWPGSAVGFSLQSKTEVASTNWQDVGQAPFIIGSDNVVTNMPTNNPIYFRLRK